MFVNENLSETVYYTVCPCVIRACLTVSLYQICKHVGEWIKHLQ